MFKRIAPQLAQHSEGYKVFIADREHAGYEDDSIRATVISDLSDGIPPLYRGTIQVTPKVDQQISSGRPSEDEIIKRIQQGLLFLGIHTEVIVE